MIALELQLIQLDEFKDAEWFKLQQGLFLHGKYKDVDKYLQSRNIDIFSLGRKEDWTKYWSVTFRNNDGTMFDSAYFQRLVENDRIGDRSQWSDLEVWSTLECEMGSNEVKQFISLGLWPSDPIQLALFLVECFNRSVYFFIESQDDQLDAELQNGQRHLQVRRLSGILRLLCAVRSQWTVAQKQMVKSVWKGRFCKRLDQILKQPESDLKHLFILSELELVHLS